MSQGVFTEQAVKLESLASDNPSSAQLSDLGGSGTDPARERYLELLKRCLMRIGMEARYEPLTYQRTPSVRTSVYRMLANAFGRRYELVRRRKLNRQGSMEGRGCSPDAESMIGLYRMNNLHDAVRTVVREKVPGDVIEAGVWRGGAAIFMRAALWAYGDEARKVWVADSFEGLPPPSADIAADAGYDLSGVVDLAVSVEEVQANFRKYGWLDDRVHFLKGWFKDTLHAAPIEAISVLRADGDLYESTMDILNALYAKVSPGGFVIVDDYGAWPPCRKAVDEFRAAHKITEPIHEVDWTGVYWRKA